MCKSKNLRATRINGYLIEPIMEGYSKKWEGHHTTNPCVVRLSKDARVFLCYRAGGDDDYYRYGDFDVWGSHLGLAVMDERGEQVVHRLPLPIMRKLRDVHLPQTKEEYYKYIKKHKDEIVVLHDFRFFEYEGYLYLIYHEGPIDDCFDCIVRMKVETFLDKVEQSIKLMQSPVQEIIDEWQRLWWKEGVWEPCGVDGSNRLFASYVVKGDIVFFPLADGTLQMCHRPYPEGIAVLNTGKDTFARATPDGLTTYGTFETCVRPGYLDNSHIGNNGSATRAKIGNVDVYIDVTHGCHNRMISKDGFNQNKIYYYPYFRVKDYQTGELLYYSEKPILDYSNAWKKYAEDGAWVKVNALLAGVMFPGGQIEIEAGKNGLDDEFIVYIGLGDTAVGAARFKLRELLPEQVIKDIQVRKEHQKILVKGIERNEYPIEEKVNGWQWSIVNDPEKRNINVIRKLKKGRQTESGIRVVNSVPGSFDADCIIFNGKSVRYLENIGWALIYKGVRWEEIEGKKFSKIGYGILVLDKENPERILYRSTEPVEGKVTEEAGWTAGVSSNKYAELLEKIEDLIPEKVMFEIKRINYLVDKGLLLVGSHSQMVIWQRQKSGLLSRDYKLSIQGGKIK